MNELSPHRTNYQRVWGKVLDKGTAVVERIIAPNPETTRVGHYEASVRRKFEKAIGREDKQDPTKGVMLRNNIWHFLMRGPVRLITPEIGGNNSAALHEVEQLKKEGHTIAYVGNHRAHIDTDTTEESMRREGYSDVADNITWIQGLRLDKHAPARFLMRRYRRIKTSPRTVPAKTEREIEEKTKINKEAIKAAKRVYRAGGDIAVLMEGERTKTGGLQEPDYNSYAFIHYADFIVPFALMNTDGSLGRNKWYPRPYIPTVAFCKPVRLVELKQKYAHLDRQTQRKMIIDDIYIRIAARLKPQYRGVYKDAVKQAS